MAEVLGIEDLKWFYSFSVLLDDLKWKDKKMEKGGDKGQPLQWVGDCLIFSCFFIVSNVILVGLFMQTQQRQGEGGTSDIHPLMLGTPSGPPYHHPLTDLFLLSDPIIIFLFLPFFFFFLHIFHMGAEIYTNGILKNRFLFVCCFILTSKLETQCSAQVVSLFWWSRPLIW